MESKGPIGYATGKALSSKTIYLSKITKILLLKPMTTTMTTFSFETPAFELKTESEY